jgi:hypothetical protein
MQIICESILHTIIKIKIIVFQHIQVIKIKQKNFTKQLYPTSKKKISESQLPLTRIHDLCALKQKRH